MNYTFSDTFSLLKPSALRESFKLAAQPGVISLAAGSPSPQTFPAKEMAEIAQHLLSDPRTAASTLQYGITEGVPTLKEAIFRRMKEKYNTGREEDGILITSGGQQGIELAAKILLNRGDGVITESPTFSNSINTFYAFTRNVVGVSLQPDGMDLDELEKTLQHTPNVKLIYCIATFQNPTGYTVSLEKRRGIYALAQKYNIIIIEDDPYYELRYSGEHVPTIKSLDDDGRVIYVGSMSKILSPGIRVGFIIANKELLAKLVIAKQGEDVHANVLCQTIAAEYFRQYDIDAHIEMIRACYRGKRDFMLQELTQHLSDKVEVSHPDGGLFLWCTMPEGCDSDALFYDCLNKGKVVITTGSGFYPNLAGPSKAFRLSFSLPSEEQIKSAVAIVGQCVNDMIKDRC